MKYFEELYKLNVNDYVEEKNGLTYLSWSYAIAEVLKKQPNMTYEIERFENGLPYVYDEKTGYMVFTKVTIEGITRGMWLPVMDSANKAMLDHSYVYYVKQKEWDDITKKYVYTKKEKTCEAATMFDINKTIMRCLTKNFAMFGLGLYIYAGQDLPEDISIQEEPIEEKKESQLLTENQRTIISKLTEKSQKSLFDKFCVSNIDELTVEQASEIVKMINEKKGNK